MRDRDFATNATKKKSIPSRFDTATRAVMRPRSCSFCRATSARWITAARTRVSAAAPLPAGGKKKQMRSNPYPTVRPVKIACGCTVREPSNEDAVRIALGEANVVVLFYCDQHRGGDGDPWNFADADNGDGTFDVFFDWLGRERRMTVVEAANAEEAYQAVKSDTGGCLDRSRLVEAF